MRPGTLRWLLPVIAAAAMSCSPAVVKDESVRNLGVVRDGAIYRGGQPDEDALKRLKDLGVRTILKLNTHDLDAEAKACAKLGLRLIHVPTKAGTIATTDECRAAEKAYAALVDESNWPIYVHCERGKDRTGYLIGLYRLRVDGWSWDRVDDELTRYGHRKGNLNQFPAIRRSLENGPPVCVR